MMELLNIVLKCVSSVSIDQIILNTFILKNANPVVNFFSKQHVNDVQMCSYFDLRTAVEHTFKHKTHCQ